MRSIFLTNKAQRICLVKSLRHNACLFDAYAQCFEYMPKENSLVEKKTGEKKKQAILKVSKELFYERGYKDTTFTDISKILDCPASTISYHFGSKIELASVIQGEYSRQNKIYIESMVGDVYSKTMLMALEILNMWKRNLENDRLRRFLIETGADSSIVTYYFDYIKYLYKVVIDEHDVEISEDKLSLMASTQIGMTHEILVISNTDLVSLDYVGYASHVITVFCKMIGFNEFQISKLIENATEIFERLPIDNRYFDYFSYAKRYLHKADTAKLLPEDRSIWE